MCVCVCVCVCVCADSYPEWVSLQWSHHCHVKRLLQKSEHCTDQGLHARQTAELGRGVPGEREREREREGERESSFMTTLYRTSRLLATSTELLCSCTLRPENSRQLPNSACVIDITLTDKNTHTHTHTHSPRYTHMNTLGNFICI